MLVAQTVVLLRYTCTCFRHSAILRLWRFWEMDGNERKLTPTPLPLSVQITATQFSQIFAIHSEERLTCFPTEI